MCMCVCVRVCAYVCVHVCVRVCACVCVLVRMLIITIIIIIIIIIITTIIIIIGMQMLLPLMACLLLPLLLLLMPPPPNTHIHALLQENAAIHREVSGLKADILALQGVSAQANSLAAAEVDGALSSVRGGGGRAVDPNHPHLPLHPPFVTLPSPPSRLTWSP